MNRKAKDSVENLSTAAYLIMIAGILSCIVVLYSTDKPESSDLEKRMGYYSAAASIIYAWLMMLLLKALAVIVELLSDIKEAVEEAPEKESEGA